MKKASKAIEPDTAGTNVTSGNSGNSAANGTIGKAGATGAVGTKNTVDTHIPSALPRSETRRKYDPEQTRRNILDVATQEFSAMGLTGARVDAIAERTNTTKRMLYYYFGSKEGLYEAVLEKVYGDIRALEQDLHVSELDPREGMRTLVEFTFDYHDRQRDFVRLVTIENIHGAKYVEQVKTFKGRNASVIHTIEDLLARGIAAGQFRDDVDAIDLHLLISSLCFHRIGNRHTFGAAFGRDPSHPRLRARHRAMIVDAVLRFVHQED